MKRYFPVLLLMLACTSCSPKKDMVPKTAMEAGTTFIRASLDGDFKTAEPLLLNDTANHQLFDSYKDFYSKLPEEKKKKYKEASYNINKFEDINDSTAIINYSNSYMNKPMEIKLVRAAKVWTVDFKYTYSGNLPIN
ncbi:MAG: hypothetical protein H7Y86_16440 [Rhizobacter sp.]|nr:hypothetical protein [Ferruginibacter sp.]